MYYIHQIFEYGGTVEGMISFDDEYDGRRKKVRHGAVGDYVSMLHCAKGLLTFGHEGWPTRRRYM